LREAWNTLDTCFDRPEKYISEALDPVVKDQTLPGILVKMPPTDWRQWAKERPAWMRGAIEEAFWNFVDQKWRDALNVAAAEPPAWGAGSGGRATPQDSARKEAAKPVKAGAAAVHMTGADGRRRRQGDSGRTCVFKDVMGCTAAHPPWLCKVFGKLPAGEREKLITDNRLCPFCLLHDKDKPCGAKQRPVSVACTVSNCKGRHVQKLHDFLKDVFREENQVHVVHGGDGWEESDEAWELGEEEMMIVGTVQQEDHCSWQDACNSWMEQDDKVAAGVHQVRACQEAAKQSMTGQCKKASVIKVREETSEPGGLLLEGEEQEYFLEILMRKASPERLEAAPANGKEKKKSRKKERKVLGKNTAEKETGGREKKKGVADPAHGLEKTPALDFAHNPEAKGRGLADGGREGERPAAGSQATSGGECSG
jgi:hypothetical protein